MKDVICMYLKSAFYSSSSMKSMGCVDTETKELLSF